MALGYGRIVTTSAADQIAQTIQQAILDGRLKADDRLPTEEELAARYGVSRPTVREALKRLVARHLIHSRRGSSGGTFVSDPSPEELAQSIGTAATLLVAVGRVSLEEVASARAEMEAICCRLAAKQRTEAHLAALRAEVAIQRDGAITDVDFCASDVRFHRVIVQAAGNALLRFLMSAVIEALLPVSNMIIFRVRDRRIITGHHERMTKALESRDADETVTALHDLMAYTSDRYAAAEKARQSRAAASSDRNAGAN